MGLLDRFRKKKKCELSETVAEILKLYFPEGQEQQIRLVNGLIQKLNNKYDYKVVLDNYVFILTCLFVDEDKSLFGITENVLNRINSPLSRDEIKTIYNYAIENNEQLSMTMGLLQKMYDMCGEGTEQDEMPQGYGEFGLEITNPIPVRGIPESKYYLNRLRLPNGDKITWVRCGSCRSENIDAIIDSYKIMDTSGNAICSLYICPYNKKTSSKRPKGFIFDGDAITINKPISTDLKSRILPEKNVSYVVDEHGKPMLVFYRPQFRLYVNRPGNNETVGYFLNIHKPLLLDVTNQEKISIPPIPDECDGIIIKGFGIYNSTAFVVRDKSQTMEITL